MELEKEINQSKFRNEYQKMIINILFTAGWLNHHNSLKLKPHGISPQQFNVLRILRGQHPNPVTINLLQERMLDRMSNASRLVEKLRQKNLVERRVCERDRRAVDVIITDQGLAVLAELDKVMIEWENECKVLSESEADTLNRLLNKLRG